MSKRDAFSQLILNVLVKIKIYVLQHTVTAYFVSISFIKITAEITDFYIFLNVNLSNKNLNLACVPFDFLI